MLDRVPGESAATQKSFAFDVATIKPLPPGQNVPESTRVYPGGRLIDQSHSLHVLISEAFGLAYWQISGGSKWVDQDEFVIQAKPPESLQGKIAGGESAWWGLSDPLERQMLQSLLMDRFHLKYHIETAPGTTYVLRRNGKPLGLRHVELASCLKAETPEQDVKTSTCPTGGFGVVADSPIRLDKVSMDQLAEHLSAFEVKAPVRNATELPGFYDFRSKTMISDDDFRSGGPQNPFRSVLGEIGLELEKTSGAVERFVIDSATLPTEN